MYQIFYLQHVLILSTFFYLLQLWKYLLAILMNHHKCMISTFKKNIKLNEVLETYYTFYKRALLLIGAVHFTV